MLENQQILFNRFRIEECLKKDRISNVYTAWHIHLDKKILLKTLNTEAIDDLGWLERFRREAKVLARLDHPNIIRALDFGSDKKVYYISFEYFESHNLRHLFKNGLLTVEQKRLILIQLLEGLEAAHHHGIIHRDIKPENILVNAAFQLKLADFGLAFRAEDSKLTSKSSLIGTPAYMSPEQIRGESLTAKTDLFSAGLVAFEMYRGFHPFLGEDVKNTINNILNFNHQEISQALTTDDPPVIAKLLHTSPDQRPSSASDTLRELGINPNEDQPGNIPNIKKRKRVLRFIVIALSVILLGVCGYIILADTNKSPELVSEPASGTMMATDTIHETSTTTKPREIPDNLEHVEMMSTRVKEDPVSPKSGTLFIFSAPVSEVHIDDQYHGKTPFRSPLELQAGIHHLQLSHKRFPDYTESIKIEPGQNKIIGFDLDTLFGYLSCQVYPWALVIVDGKLIGETPLAEPVILVPGPHSITVENPGFQRWTDSLIITKQETTFYKINLEKRARK